MYQPDIEARLNNLEFDFWLALSKKAPDVRYGKSYAWKMIKACVKADRIRFPSRQELQANIE